MPDDLAAVLAVLTGAPRPGDVPVYVTAPDDGSHAPGDRVRCTHEGCVWTQDVSEVDADATLSDALRHVADEHGITAFAQAAPLIVAERRADLVTTIG